MAARRLSCGTPGRTARRCTLEATFLSRALPWRGVPRAWRKIAKAMMGNTRATDRLAMTPARGHPLGQALSTRAHVFEVTVTLKAISPKLIRGLPQLVQSPPDVPAERRELP
mmetsp:Transcript_30508/g.83789  ORF Transcript_30508/g.83789 Transcript_30508/m.83789 type:complete len:112 (-) Transcript_30508:79-414(-)